MGLSSSLWSAFTTVKKFISPPLIWGHSLLGEFMKYTRFEKARIIGARALQISLGAPVLLDISEGVIDPIQIAMTEYDKGVIPITVKRDE
jgi:DNA-directed RNA polymerase subunit K